jgi:putative selenate reductase
MPELVPYPFDALARRMVRELGRDQAIFDLPASRFVLGDPERDRSVRFHGLPASSPLGPAAGPHTQMAQNLVLSWLGGCRIMELKTVQILDELDIPRPCIDMRTVGYNVEWSQELKLAQSLEEYVKGSMLIEMLRSGGGSAAPREGFGDVLYDLSVGYDLEGIQSDAVDAFLRGMLDATDTVQRLRAEIPRELGALRDLEFPTRLSETVTLSTFHGCPPDEIERIIDHLMRRYRLHSTIKFNPTLLGSERVHGLLREQLGYDDVSVPDSAFERDTRWEQAVEMLERLDETARELGLGVGAKFSNTLIVRNDAGFLAPEEKEAYLSGPPLHVLAMRLVKRFRDHFGDRFPISFAAGIDRQNFPDAVALGLTPITVCSDLLQKGGYGRLSGYYRELDRRMDEVGARTVDDFVLLAYGQGESALERLGLDRDDPARERCLRAIEAGDGLREAVGEELFARWVSEARRLNTDRYVEALDRDDRYSRPRHATPPRKIGRHLKLFDCLTCDLCIPVCPNDANFTLHAESSTIPTARVGRTAAGLEWSQGEEIELAERHQIANFADFCNDCGNCDVFCPEDGGPYKIKPRFFGEEAAWRAAPELDGFWVTRRGEIDVVLGRFDGVELRLETDNESMKVSGDGFALSFDRDDPPGTLRGEIQLEGGTVDLTHAFVMDWLRRAVLDGGRTNYVNARV